jgi:pimeloyl-ACP methyl ester carboxylesterase
MFAAAAMLTALLLVAGLTVGFAWYLTSRLIGVTHVHDTYPLRVLAVGTRDATVTLTAGPDAAEPGTFRLAWPGGYGIVGPVTASGHGFVTRPISDATGHLTVGQQAGIEPGRYTGDPMTALGIHYAAVGVPAPLGAMPAWQISGRRSTWVILIHGLGGNRADTLAAIAALHVLGFPILAITYRNDAGAPASPDHQNHLGATEWHDVDAAVRYATKQGASGVVLYGYSLGAAMAMVTAEDSPVRGRVRGLVLDSPILDWQATLTYQGDRHGLPAPLISLSERLLAWRTGLNFAQFNQLQHETSLQVPVLLIQGTADTIVPPGLADAFARGRPRRVTYLRVAGADHVSAMDTDPGAYGAALRRFLTGSP